VHAAILYTGARACMFIRNKTRLDVRLAKASVTDELAVAAVVVRCAYRVTGDALSPLAELPEPLPTDPPDTSIHAVWDGVSVTAAGHAHAPKAPPFVRLVELRVGAVARRLSVFGDRVWERAAGVLVASEARPFDAIEISFARAFGGSYVVPPGMVPGTDLPHPGFLFRHRRNPGGVGIYPDEARATGAPLPSIERPDQLLRRWNDDPLPAGFSVGADLIGWRVEAEAQPRIDAHFARGGTAADFVSEPPSFRLLHHAPPDLVFDDVPPGTSIALSGLGDGPVRFTVPPCPGGAQVAGRKGPVEVAPRLRAIHVDADRRLVLTEHDLAFRYDPRTAPDWVRVTAPREARS
jgi:hypothetical protein